MLPFLVFYIIWCLSSFKETFCQTQGCCCCCWVASVMTLCDPTDGSPPGSHPWDSPGENAGVGCHFLLQCRKVKSESEVTQSCLILRDPMDCSPSGSSIHRIFQATVLEWGALAFSDSRSLRLFPLFASRSYIVLSVTFGSRTCFKLMLQTVWGRSLYFCFCFYVATNCPRTLCWGD